MAFAIQRRSRGSSNNTHINARAHVTTGIMTNGGAQIILDSEEKLVVNEESPLLVSEKGDKGDKGDMGERGRRGAQGKMGLQTLSWSEEITLKEGISNLLVMYPHYKSSGEIDRISIVVSGNGSVTFSLVDKLTNKKIALVEKELTEDFAVISHEDFDKIDQPVSILSLEAVVTEQTLPIKFLALTLTLKRP